MTTIDRHLARQEACEGQRDKELDSWIFELRSDFNWAVKRCDDLLELKPDEEEQVSPKDLFHLYSEMMSTMSDLRRVCAMGGCELIREHSWQRSAGCKNDFE